MLNPTQEEIRIMAREYHAEYTSNGGDTSEAMGVVLKKNNIPEFKQGSVAERVRNYRSETVISLSKKPVIPIRVRLAGRKCGGFTVNSLPNGDRD